MSSEDLRGGQSAVFIAADGSSLSHEYTGVYGPHPTAYDMGNLDYHRDMIPGYEAASMYMGHPGAETMYASTAYGDPSVYHAAYQQTAVSCGYPTFTPHSLMPHDSYPTLDALNNQIDTRGNVVIGPNGKPKRRRVASVAQRRAANIRERRRMFNLNEAFDILRKRVPTFAYEKRLSRIETLRLAITYIAFMADVLDGKDPGNIKLISLKGASGIDWSAQHCVKKEGGGQLEDGDLAGDPEDDDNSENGNCSTRPVSPGTSEGGDVTIEIPVTAEEL